MPVGEIVQLIDIVNESGITTSHSVIVVLGDQASFSTSTVFYLLGRGNVPANITRDTAQAWLDSNITLVWSQAQQYGRLITYPPEVMIRRLFGAGAVLGKVANELYNGGLATQVQGDATLAAALTELSANSVLMNRFNSWRLYMNIGVSTVPGLLTAANINLLTAADRRSALRELQCQIGFWVSAADAVTLLSF